MDKADKRIAILKKAGKPLKNTLDLNPLIDKLSNSRLVLLGEASHGTHEYYTWRTAISKRLIEEFGFNFIAVEGDWPDFYRLNRYVKHYIEGGGNAIALLKEFNRWPTWMWANWETEALIEWLRKHNQDLPANDRVGIYGLDVYSLWESMEVIINYLKKNDPSLLPSAKRAIGCFEPYSDEMGMAYARSLRRLVPQTCENEVVALLRDIKEHAQYYLNSDVEASLNMEQNAHIAKNAEKYYRSMIYLNESSWNVRDQHMMDTLKRLLDFHGSDAKAIIWEHNTHVGDARATDMVLEGSINVGQLVREQLPDYNPKIVGFGSYQGSVIAGAEWGSPMRKMKLPQAIDGSWEYMMHQAAKKNQLLLMESIQYDPLFENKIPHRAVGVVYHPRYEKIGNYVPSDMPQRYDAFIHIDQSEALHPMQVFVDKSQLPGTYPWAF